MQKARETARFWSMGYSADAKRTGAAMLIYHGTPITPRAALDQMRGESFCVSFAAPEQVEIVHRIGQTVMLDNGAFSAWKRRFAPDWGRYYAWVEKWSTPITWAVVPDSVDGGVEENDALLAAWPHPQRRGAPVWHLHEPIGRLLTLCEGDWDRVCFGSSGQYSSPGDAAWSRRVDRAWNEMARTFGTLPRIHMLRGLSVSGQRWPWLSADSTDIARNHHLPRHTTYAMAARWRGVCSPVTWAAKKERAECSTLSLFS